MCAMQSKSFIYNYVGSSDGFFSFKMRWLWKAAMFVFGFRIEKLKDIDILALRISSLSLAMYRFIIGQEVCKWFWVSEMKKFSPKKNRLYSAETGWNAVVNDQIKSADYFFFFGFEI